MASIVTTNNQPSPAFPHSDPLSVNPAEWPDSARSAYRGVLSQLDAWSRSHDASKVLNSWIAEEAVRQSW